MESRIQVALVAAKLRSLKHYCPKAVELNCNMERVADILAEGIERVDATITPREFKGKLEHALRETDSKDYDLREKGTLMPITRLAFLEFVLEEILPPEFYKQLRETYSINK